jgi:hypothetical protein
VRVEAAPPGTSRTAYVPGASPDTVIGAVPKYFRSMNTLVSGTSLSMRRVPVVGALSIGAGDGARAGARSAGAGRAGAGVEGGVDAVRGSAGPSIAGWSAAGSGWSVSKTAAVAAITSAPAARMTTTLADQTSIVDREPAPRAALGARPRSPRRGSGASCAGLRRRRDERRPDL